MFQQGTEKSIFRVLLWIGFGIMTAMIWHNIIFRFNLFWIESFDTWVVTLESHEKKICIMWQQGTEMSVFRVFFQIGFDIVTTMALQIPFPDSTYFKLKVLILECASLESYGKNAVECSSKEQRSALSELIFWIGFGIITAMFVQNTISKFNLFWIASFDTWVCYFGEPWKKKSDECRSNK